jgi:hypothetical protein
VGRRRAPDEVFQQRVEECDSITCTRLNGKCIGWHCPYCTEPCSSQGHDCEGWTEGISAEEAWGIAHAHAWDDA